MYREVYPKAPRGIPKPQKMVPMIKDALAHLRARIIRELYIGHWHEVWFFPSRGGVKGWRGTGRIMFVGLNPSGGHFPSLADPATDKRVSESGSGN